MAAPNGWEATARTVLDTGRPLPGELTTPVLVCGAGPTGLATALLLARQGVPSTVVERHPGPSIHPKARGLSARSMEVLDRIGLADEVAAIGEANEPGEHRVSTVASLAGEVLASFVVGGPATDASQGSPWPGALVGQDALEGVLARACLDHPLVDLRYRIRMTGSTPTGDGMRARLEDRSTGRVAVAHASWMVGADGGTSAVRRSAGIPFDGEFDLDRNVNVLFEADLGPLVAGRRSVVYVVRGPGAPCSVMAVDNRRRWLCTYRVPPGESVEHWSDEATVRQVLRRAIGRDDVPFAPVSTVVWSPSAALAGRYREGRVLLAGDAAHLMPPTGAMGANTGLQDADNLAWKLAACLDGHARPALLDTYERERRPVAVSTVGAALSIFRDPGGLGRPRQVPAEVLLDYRYEDGALVPAAAEVGGPVPGARAPHLGPAATDPVTRRLGPGLSLVVGLAAGRWGEAARAGELPLDTVVVDPRSDPDGRVRRTWGLDSGGAVLVRPDGVVAWHAPSPGCVRDLAGVTGRVLGHGR